MTSPKLKIALMGNIYQAKKSAAIQHILSCLKRNDVDVYIDREYYYFLKDFQHLELSETTIFDADKLDVDFVISMGGDGTFLKSAAQVGNKHIPILGVNMGRLGFLADVNPKEIDDCIAALIAGDYAVEDRVVIQVETDKEQFDTWGYALNDVAILKRDMASMISVRATINGEYLNTYQADGIIVCTPTGSTAYSLSNGGPIIVPGTHVLAITAVAPHSLNMRPIIIPDDSEIMLEVESRSHNFLVAIDGRSEKCKEGTTVTLRKAPYCVSIVKRCGAKFYSSLREKMMWGADSRD